MGRCLWQLCIPDLEEDWASWAVLRRLGGWMVFDALAILVTGIMRW